MGKVPPQLRGFKFKSGGKRAKKAGSKGGKISRPPNKSKKK